jgi:2-hydroxychromene-2-carboxylate isomerase
MNTIDYFLAPQSPYCYLGHARVGAIAKKHRAKIHLKPTDLGKVFPQSGGLPLAQRPAQRQAYRFHELRRWSEYLDLPLNLKPKYFPVSGDLAARMILAAPTEQGAFDFAGAVLTGVWAKELNIADEGTLVTLAKQCGLDGEKMLLESPATQAQYDLYTNQAIEAQVFGAPWFIVNGEPFWGQDRLDFLDRALATSHARSNT